MRMRGSVCGQEHIQIFTGRFRITHMELYGLALLHDLTDRNRAGRLVGPQQIPNQKIASLEPVAVLIDDNPKVERPMGSASVFLPQRFEDGLQPFQRRDPSKLMDQVPFRLRHHKPVADQPASLGDDGPNINRPGEADTDQSTIEYLIVENQPIHAGLMPASS
jgi:hypothetical protein